ncbi:Palmitoyltransferase ZDHHC17 (Acyltransferase ZDHHC17) (DHHC domain-containing cysteine-rich protein 17) (Zinc finger DHHC domain-containing protein 17), partial [Durusdinium trenchii]
GSKPAAPPPPPAPPAPATGGDGAAQGESPAPAPEVSSLEDLGLEPNTAVQQLSNKYANMTQEQQAEARAHAARVEAMVEAKLKTMTPEQRKEFQRKHDMLTKAVQLQLKSGGSPGMVQPKLTPHLPPPLPEKTEEELRDEEIHFAIRSGQVDELDELLTKHEKNVNFSVKAPNDKDAHPLLHWASLNDQKEVIEYMLKKNVNVDQRNPRGEVALHWAALNGHIRSVHLLVEAGCDRMAKDARGYSAMHHAAQFGRTVVMALLLRRGVNVDIRDNNGRTPLHWAAYKDEGMAAAWLLEHGADVAAQDFERCLPIHWAALQGLYGMSTVLMKFGSLPYLGSKDNTGGTPASLAREKQQKHPKESYQHKAFRHVADYLETCSKKNKDVSSRNSRAKHPTWYTWPVLAPIGFWQYYTVVMPETYFYPILTLTFWFFYWAEWVSWSILQFKNPGTYILRDEEAKKAREGQAAKGGSNVTQTTVHGENGNGETVVLMADDTCLWPTNPKQRRAALYRQMYLEVLDKGLTVPVCTTCEIVKPLRSKHDSVTNVCISKFDHFCPFMGVAIGEDNYFYFFFAMWNAFICMLCWLYMVVLYTASYHHNKSFLSNFWELLYWEMFALLYFPIALYGLLMVGQHLYFIKQNITTNEVMNRHRYRYLANGNPFDKGVVKNALEFLGVVETLEADLYQYYEIEWSGRSLPVEESNRRLKGGLPPTPPQLNKDCCSHGHSHGH